MPTLISAPIEISKIFSKLWLGSLWNAKKLLERNTGVGLVLNCTDEVIPRVPGVHMLQLGLRDRGEIPASKIAYAVRVLQEYLREAPQQRAALVCCHASQSRSPAIVLAYLLGPVI